MPRHYTLPEIRGAAPARGPARHHRAGRAAPPDAVADSNVAYWHSAPFNNDDSKILFTDERGGGRQPKCRASDPMEGGANALFTVDDDRGQFQGYDETPAKQTA